MTNYQTYTAAFLNTETTRPDNELVQQRFNIIIYDSELVANDNPFDVKYRTRSNGDGTMSIFVTWGALPGVTEDFRFSYSADQGSTWNDFGPRPPADRRWVAVGVPEGDYVYSFVLNYPGDSNPRFLLSTLPEIGMELSEQPLVIAVVNNEEDKFAPIRSKQATITVLTDSDINIGTFIEGSDRRFYVEIFMNDVIQFVGYLSTSDMSQTFMPDPQELVLTATDGLGFLADLPLMDLNGDAADGVNDILTYISWALNQTGLYLDISACMNIRDIDAAALNDDEDSEGHFYKFNRLDAKTFETEVGEREDSSTVLSKILGFNSFLCQHEGVWTIVRIDEFRPAEPFTYYRWSYQGDFISKETRTDSRNIGVEYSIGWMNEDAQVSVERAYRQVRLNYTYDYPKELICNIEFSRGDGPGPDRTDPDQTIDQTPECWQFLREGTTPAGLDSPPFAGSVGLLRKRYEYAYEKERYLVTKTAGGFRHYFKSEGAPVEQGDKTLISIDYRTDTLQTINNVFPMHVRLVGEDGFLYDWEYDANAGNSGTWVQKTAASVIFDTMVGDLWSGQDTREWKTTSGETPPFPATGRLFIRLTNGFAPTHELWFSNLRVNYYNFVNGSYTAYTGQRSQVEQSFNTVAALDETVFISDAPNRIMKGAILKEGDTDDLLASQFYDASLFPTGAPGLLDIHPFGYLQVFDVWNQHNRTMVKFEGTLDGTESNGGSLPDLTDKYALLDPTDYTTTGPDQIKYFMLLHFEKDIYLCQWEAFFYEVVDSGKSKSYDGFTFTYIESE